MESLGYIIELISEKYIDDVINISNLQFGKGYLHRDGLLKNDQIVLIARKGDVVLGFGLAQTWSTPDSGPEDIHDMFRQDKVGVLKTVGVKPGYELEGIGTALFTAIVEQLKSIGVYQFYLEAWYDGYSVRVEKIVHQLGFKQLKVVPEFWYDDSLRRGYQCAICGHPCRCTAVLYYRVDAI